MTTLTKSGQHLANAPKPRDYWAIVGLTPTDEHGNNSARVIDRSPDCKDRDVCVEILTEDDGDDLAWAEGKPAGLYRITVHPYGDGDSYDLNVTGAELLFPLNAAAEIPMPAEGAGLREASEQMVMAGYDHWRQAKPPGLFAGPKSEIEWMEGIINAALSVRSSESGRNHVNTPRPTGNNADEWNAWLAEHSGYGTAYIAVQIAQALDAAALASPQPAVEGPIAAGVNTLDTVDLSVRCSFCVTILGERVKDRYCVNCNPPPPRTTPPADPKPTVPGNDAGMREATHCAYRAGAVWASENPIHADMPAQRTIAADRYISSLAPQTGSAGEDPKTPDAGGGFGDGRRICEALGFDPANHHNALKCPYCNPDGLKFAAPVGEDETGVREAAQFVHDTFARDLAQGYKTKDKDFAVAILGAALSAAPAARPGDGVGIPQEIRDLHTDAAVAKRAYEDGTGSWSDYARARTLFECECCTWIEGQLAAAPDADGGRA
ncbi:hypothetical protein ASF22_02590 [Methylobacterium sp. Leaf87]|uniref:hypothetical protein n=1 Tax=Methylobacterium sp. Leaf87 TaxID=1736243 RepID=UPI0006F425AA|nr:hypothetical protein [Methylobacterium sp. Leaf87]KQO69515.1 hypothetical protein ASF22_02590 [Methylobacterium sp. Leaf87]